MASPLDSDATPRSPDRPDVSDRPGAIRRLRTIWEYRELLVNLIRKELKVKYKNSALGFVWSLLNPLLYLVVFYIVFQVILEAGISNFPIFFLAGLLPWNLFGAGLGGGTTAIVSNAGLVGKVWFPREILPLASIGAALVHFALQFLVLAGALVAFWYEPAWSYLPLLIPAMITFLVFVAALAVAFSAINVYARDTQHLLELVMLAWFWLTPIIYPFRQVGSRVGNWALLNPMTSIVITFQRAIWGNREIVIKGQNGPAIPDGSQWWYLRNLGFVFGASLLLLWIAFWIFGRLEDNLAESI